LISAISMAALASEPRSFVVLPNSDPQPENRQLSCLEGASCSTNQDCYNCSGYATATCTEDGCHYTYGSPGGGTGGGGPRPWDSCPQLPCDDSRTCVCQDDQGTYHFGQCLSAVCQY
jgi:hypothetical protein